MLKNSLDRQILGLALPAIVANITTPLLSLVDVAIVGHLGSAVYVGAIAVGGSIFSMLYWLFGFLRFGTSGLTAQALGRGSARQTSLLLQRSLLIALGFGIILITAHYPLGHAALSFMDTDADTAGKAWLYFSILIYGAPASLATFALTGWFVGMQDTRTPMWISLLVNVVNITASLILVYAMDYDLAGVAYGTLLAQWTGFIVSAATCAIHYKVRPQPLSELLHVSELKTFFKVNTDIFLRTVCLIAVTVWFTRTGAGLGPVMLAVNTLLMQFFILFSYIMDGFAFAGEAICGKSYGASDSHSLNRQIHRLLQWGAGARDRFYCRICSRRTVSYRIAYKRLRRDRNRRKIPFMGRRHTACRIHGIHMGRSAYRCDTHTVNARHHVSSVGNIFHTVSAAISSHRKSRIMDRIPRISVHEGMPATYILLQKQPIAHTGTTIIGMSK